MQVQGSACALQLLTQVSYLLSWNLKGGGSYLVHPTVLCSDLMFDQNKFLCQTCLWLC